MNVNSRKKRIRELLNKRCSISDIARIQGVSRQAIHSFIQNHDDLNKFWLIIKQELEYNKRINSKKSKRLEIAILRRKVALEKMYGITYEKYCSLGKKKQRILHRQYMMWKRKVHACNHQSKIFEIEFKDIKWPKYCPVLGAKIDYSDFRLGVQSFSPSFDKIIPKLGYVKGNVQIISYKANYLKRDATLADLEKIIRYIRHNSQAKDFWFAPGRFKARQALKMR